MNWKNRNLLWILLAAVGLPLSALTSEREGNIYIAPQGTPSGPGTRGRPYDLSTALSGAVGHGGDTFWLEGGVYRVGHVATQVHGTAEQPITFRVLPGQRAQVIGSLSVWGAAGNVTFRDFELCSGAAKRVSSQQGAGFSPKDLPEFLEGIQVYASNCRFINLTVHDSVRSAFYTSEAATNTLIYGCIVYYAGWASQDNAEGHSFYLQGAGEAAENLAFNSAGAGFHVYANSQGACLRNLILRGNVAFGAGALQNVRAYRDWIVGVDSPATTADNIVLQENMGYVFPGASTLAEVQLGREHLNGRIAVVGNYWPQGMALKSWHSVNVTDNFLAPQNSDFVVDLEQDVNALNAVWDRNVYSSPLPTKAFCINGKLSSFSEWKKCTGFDSVSSWKAGPLSGTRIFVRSNRYEPGRANIVVYNWERSSYVAVDVCSVLAVGLYYEVRNAEDYFAPPVRTGIFDGRPLELPMRGLSVAKPTGGLKIAPATGPVFNVFVLLPGKPPNGSPGGRTVGGRKVRLNEGQAGFCAKKSLVVASGYDLRRAGANGGTFKTETVLGWRRGDPGTQTRAD